MFDPVLSSADIKVLMHLGMHAVGGSDDAAQAGGNARQVDENTATLFYMPHCEAELTDELLAANWGEGRLSRIAIIGAQCC